MSLLHSLYPNLPAVIAGDFNIAAFPRDPEIAQWNADWFQTPGRIERLFDRMADNGFSWLAVNTPGPTLRSLPVRQPEPPLNWIDCVFVRGVTVSILRVWSAVDEQGAAISDHQLLTVDIMIDVPE